MKKLIALLLACMMVIGLFAACAGEAKPTEPKADDTKPAGTEAPAPTEGGETAATGSVYYLNFKPEFDGALQELAKTYTENTGVPVKVVTAAS